MRELRLMKGNEALAEAAIRMGVDAFFGYPITPQSEIIEHLMAEKAYERTGMVVLQTESEIASINMIYGGGACGKKVMTSSSGPGISLMQEGISYIVGAEIPCLIVNIERGGPGLGTIQPSQSDYFQATKGGGHGDYKLIVLAPNSVQEMADFVKLGFDLAFKYRNPAIILSDGAIGQMMEKVYLDEPVPRETIPPRWAITGKSPDRERIVFTSLELESTKQEQLNLKIQAKYRLLEEQEVRFEKVQCDDAEYLFVAFGLCSRICRKSLQMARDKGIKAGLLRPITLYPYPYKEIKKLSEQLKGILDVEMNAGQMVEDVRLAVEGRVKVEHYGRFGGIIPSPEDVLNALEKKIINQ